MAKRTPEEIRQQREAWMARKTARESGQDVPAQQLQKPNGTSVPPAEPEPTQPASEPAVAQPSDESKAPPAKKNSRGNQGPTRGIFGRQDSQSRGRCGFDPGRAQTGRTKEASPAPKPAPAKAAVKPKPARPAAPAPAAAGPNINRREFLNYAWLASIALISVQTVGLSLWFAFPNFKAGQFGGQFDIGSATDVVPPVNSGPAAFTDGKFWLVDVDQEVNGERKKGVLAIYKVCTHLGCLYEWVPITNRFECPCHGSKFDLTGEYIAGPARRSLDRFAIQAVSPDGTVKETDADGNPLEITGDETLIVDTGNKILGSSDITPA